MMNKLSHEQYKIIEHSLGTTGKKKLPKEFYRNRFIAGENHDDFSILIELEQLRFMERTGPWPSYGNAYMWWVTDEGIEAYKEQFKKNN